MDYPVLGKSPDVATAVVPLVLDGDGNAVPAGNGSVFANIAANGTTVIKAGAGVLERIVVNKKGASANDVTIYDGEDDSGIKIATLDTVNGTIGAIEYGVAFTNGLTLVLATGTAADLTVVYR
jgi:hypothetical protein